MNLHLLLLGNPLKVGRTSSNYDLLRRHFYDLLKKRRSLIYPEIEEARSFAQRCQRDAEKVERFFSILACFMFHLYIKIELNMKAHLSPVGLVKNNVDVMIGRSSSSSSSSIFLSFCSLNRKQLQRLQP